MHRSTALLLMACLGAGVCLAQDPAEADKTRPTREEKTEESREEREETLRERVRRAVQLPRTTEEARQEGAAEEDVQAVLKTGREQRIPAGDMQEILEGETGELREGRRDNFGASVREMKASGLRGRELADAIHAEQSARGMKKHKHKDKGRDGNVDRPDDGRYGDVDRHADEHGDERADAYHDRETRDREALERTKGRANDEGKSKGQGKGQGKGR